MNENPHRARGGAARAAVFFLAAWLIAAAISAVPVVLQVRGYVQAAEAAGTQQAAPDPAPSEQGGSTPAAPTAGSTAQVPTGGAVAPPASTKPGTPPPAPSTSQPVPSTSQPAQYTPVGMTVQHTCGASGKGDCFLTVRTGPDSDKSAVRTYNEGDSLTGECWVNGESVTPSATGVTTTKWVRLAGGGYVTGGYVSSLGHLSPC